MASRNVLIGAGIITGLAGPLLGMYSFYFFNFRATEFDDFIYRLLYSTLFAPVLSVCVVINLLLFFSFIWLDRDEGARGVLFSTIIYAIIVFILKLF